jgi:hypothetical protein
MRMYIRRHVVLLSGCNRDPLPQSVMPDYAFHGWGPIERPSYVS